ncbi:MAG TPA: hypothetical protein VG692_15225, partial [Gemmatimonadales bacterium]|nr:hypothetical protein [Gemmatimonadales bacterium]
LSVEGALHPSGEALERLEWDRAWMSNRTAGWLIPVTAPVHRLLAARAVAAMGDTSRAIRLLNFVDGQPMRGSSGPLEGEPAWGTALLRPYALLERARLHEGSGDLRLARLDYEAFLRHFDRPVPALQKLREEGERGYARVTGARELRAD